MIELRSYQLHALETLHREIQEKDILLLQAATGAGKTVIVVRLIARYFKDHPGRTYLILMHKQELVTQFLKSFNKFTDISLSEIGVACSGISPNVDISKRITIASVQTLCKRIGKYPGADLVIVDETHRVKSDIDTQYGGLLAKLREYKPAHKVIGVTATAIRLGHGKIYGDQCKPGAVNFFPELTHRITYNELLLSGHLMPLVGRIASDESITADLKSVSVNGDYNLGQLGNVMVKAVHVQSAVDGLEKYGEGHNHVCIFACTIEHCKALVAAFISSGHSAVPIHSQMSPIERESNLLAWKSGDVRIAVSVNILIEGFDFPDLSCLVFCRPTKSPTIYIQAIGRILRKSEGKTEALLIDLTDNTKTFGLDVDNPYFIIPSADGEGEAPYKICPGENQDGTVCGQSVHASLRYCPHCFYAFPVTEEVEAKIGKLDKVTFNAKPIAESFAVTHVDYAIHDSKKSGKRLIKVMYGCGMLETFTEYVCLADYYDGYAVTKAVDWWEKRSAEPMPQTVDEFMFLADSLIEPMQIMVFKDGKFDRITDCVFELSEDEEDELYDNFVPVESDSMEVPF